MMKSLVLRPHLGCLSVVFEVVCFILVVGLTNKLFANQAVNNLVMLAFLARWIHAAVTSPYSLLGTPPRESGHTLVGTSTDRDDADAGSDAGGDAGGDAGSD